jgi:hypothetical protein
MQTQIHIFWTLWINAFGDIYFNWHPSFPLHPRLESEVIQYQGAARRRPAIYIQQLPASVITLTQGFSLDSRTWFAPKCSRLKVTGHLCLGATHEWWELLDKHLGFLMAPAIPWGSCQRIPIQTELKWPHRKPFIHSPPSLSIFPSFYSVSWNSPFSLLQWTTWSWVLRRKEVYLAHSFRNWKSKVRQLHWFGLQWEPNGRWHQKAWFLFILAVSILPIPIPAKTSQNLQKILAAWTTQNSKHKSREFHVAWKERKYPELLSKEPQT